MARDTQKQKTYDAETSAFLNTSLEAPVGLWALEQVATKVYRSDWWRTHEKGYARPTIVAAHATATSSRAHYASREVRIAYGMDTVATLCHELAHFISPGGHDAGYRAAMVELVRLCASDVVATRLRDCYDRSQLPISVMVVPAASGVAGLADFVLDAVPANDVKHVRRVMALLAKAASTSAAESEALRAKALELSARHGISLAHLDAQAAMTAADLVEHRVRIGAGPYVGARFDLLHALARAHCCELLWTNDRLGRVVMVFGHRGDVSEVEMLYGALDHQARREMLEVATVGNVIAFRRSWLAGFASAVGATLTRETDTATEGSSPEAVSTSLVLKERRARVNDFRTTRHPHTRHVGGTQAQAQYGAYSKGAAAGARATTRSHRAVRASRLALGA